MTVKNGLQAIHDRVFILHGFRLASGRAGHGSSMRPSRAMITLPADCSIRAAVALMFSNV